MPVIPPASGLARKTTAPANSSASRMRPTGLRPVAVRVNGLAVEHGVAPSVAAAALARYRQAQPEWGRFGHSAVIDAVRTAGVEE